jgi:hypothetical protein
MARLVRQWRLGLGQNSHGELALYRENPTNSWPRWILVYLFRKSQPNHEDWSWIRRGNFDLGMNSVPGR